MQQDKTHAKLSQLEQQDDANINAAKERTREKFLACGTLAGCDKRRFGNLTEDLENNHTFGDNECPTTMQKSHECSMNCKKQKQQQ